MAIKTTLNIHKSIIELIESSSVISGFTNNEIIIRLLQRAMKEYPKLYHKGTRRIKYQVRDIERRWKPTHISFTEAEYEYVNDMKKLYKMSISNILAFAARNFLNSEIFMIINEKNFNKNDNYRFSCYAIVMEFVENIICWKYYWGIPQNISLLLPKNQL